MRVMSAEKAIFYFLPDSASTLADANKMRLDYIYVDYYVNCSLH